MEVPRVPLRNAACRQVAIYPTPQQVRRVQPELRSLFVFFCHPTPALASWRHPLWCSGLGLRAGLAKEEQCTGGWMDGWMKAAQIKRGGISFLLIDPTVQQRNPLIFTWLDPFIELGENVTICRNASCLNFVENPSFNPGFLFLKENRSSNHVTSYNGFELLNREHGNSGQSIMPRALYL